MALTDVLPSGLPLQSTYHLSPQPPRTLKFLDADTLRVLKPPVGLEALSASHRFWPEFCSGL